MATTTGIEWTDKTYNPWIGCTKVSPGCANCYAETLALQKGFVDAWGPSGTRRLTKTANEVIEWNQAAIANKTRSVVFCASLGDVFEDNPQLTATRNDLWRLVKQTPFLDWMILTKRPQNIASMLPGDWGSGYPHVSLMVSAENQACFDERVPVLQGIKSKRRALSVEPLLGPISVPKGGLKGIDMVIVGGESGQGSRPMNPEWVRGLRDACAREGVAFFFKQWGNWGPDSSLAKSDLSNAVVFTGNGEKPIRLGELPEGERAAHLKKPNAQVVYLTKSKTATGKELDGQIHNAHPYRNTPAANGQLPKLTASESRELAKLEAIVKTAMEHFWKAGQALRQIRDLGLYRDTHTTFEAYCLDRWGVSRAEAYRQIGAATVVEDLSIADGHPVPTTASQTRPLMKLKTAALRREAWNLACVKGVKVTAEVVDEVVSTMMGKVEAQVVDVRVTEAGAPAEEETQLLPIHRQISDIVAEIRMQLGPDGAKPIDQQLQRLSQLADELQG